MVARVLFPWTHSLEEHDRLPTAGDHQGNKSRTHPLIHHPRPYGSPGLLPDFPAEVDAYGAQFIAPLRPPVSSHCAYLKWIGARGRLNVKVLPLPGVLSTSMVP